MNPYISIVIPLYNKEHEIAKTLESALNQTFTDFEIIIVNDGSTDRSLDIVKQITDKRITIYNTENNGVSHARNYGIEKASAKLIAFLDADDLWYEHHLVDLKQLHEEFPDCGMYCKAYEKKDGDVLIPSQYKNIPKINGWSHIVQDYFDSSTINSIAWTSAVMLPKTTLDSIGNFDENITLGAGEDTDLWIRIALQYPVAFSNKVSALHQLDSGNRLSHSNTNSRQFINLDKYEDLAVGNPSLKRYLDLNRYAIAIQYKLSGDIDKAKDYIYKINKNSLNRKQQFLIGQTPRIMRLLFKLKHSLRKRRIQLSSFR